MLKDITLGQFFPGDSYIHRLDPRTKLLMVVVYIVALFMAKGWLAYGLVIAFLAMCIKISGIPFDEDLAVYGPKADVLKSDINDLL